MYVTFRSFKAHPGKLQDAIGVATWVCQTINDKAGSDLGVSIAVGGDPDSMNVTGMWETLGAYEAIRADLATDPELASAMRLASDLVTNEGDAIGQLMRAPGERSAYVGFNRAAVQLARLADAVPFVLEVAETATEITGNEVGVVRAFTGDMNTVMWFSFHDSLQALAESQAKLDADANFREFYKRSEDIMVPNVLESGIRQYV